MADRMATYHNPKLAQGISAIGRMLAGSAQDDANIALGRHRDALALQQEDRYNAIQEVANSPMAQILAGYQYGQDVNISPKDAGASARMWAYDPERISQGLSTSRLIGPSIAESQARAGVSDAQALKLKQETATEAAKTELAADPYGLRGLAKHPSAVNNLLISLDYKPSNDPEANYALLLAHLGRTEPQKVSDALLLSDERKKLQAKAGAVRAGAKLLNPEDAGDRAFALAQVPTLGGVIPGLGEQEQETQINSVIRYLNHSRQAKAVLELAKQGEVLTQEKLDTQLARETYDDRLEMSAEQLDQAIIRTMILDDELVTQEAKGELQIAQQGAVLNRLQNLTKLAEANVDKATTEAEKAKAEAQHERLLGMQERRGAGLVNQLRRLQVDGERHVVRLKQLSANNQLEEEKRTLEALQKKITDDKALRGIKLQIARIDHQMKLGEQAHVAVVQASTEHVAEEAVEQALTQTMMLDEKLKVQRQRAKIELSKARTSEQGNAARAKLDEVNLQIAQNRQKRETLLGKLQVERVLIETEQAGKESAITNKKYEITEEELEQAMEKSDVLSQKHVYGVLYEAGKLRLQQVELGKKQIELEAAKAGAVGTDAQRESAQELAKITQQIADLKRQEQTIRTRVAQNTEAAKVREAEAQANTAEAVASAKRGTLSNTLTISEQRKKQSILTTEAMEAAKAFRKEADPVQQQILAARLARMELAGSPTGVADDELVTITNYDGWNENYEISFSLYKDLVKAIEAGNVSDDDLVREMVTTPLDHSDSQFAQNPEDAREVVQAIRELLAELPARRVRDAFPPSSGPLNVPLHPVDPRRDR